MRFGGNKLVGAGAGAVLAATAAFVTPWEGMRTEPYFDIVQLQTVCVGETHVEMRTYTVAECQALLAQSLVKYDNGLKACLTQPIPDSVHVAFLSATYNIGAKAFCGSSMARLANAGQFEAACDALLAWNTAGGKFVKGLDSRRRAEREVCWKDLL